MNGGPDPPRGPGPSSLQRRLIGAGAIVSALALGGLIATWSVQQLVTFPRPPAAAWDVAARAAADGEQVWLDANGDRVEAWLLPARAAVPAPLVIYAHGNGEIIDMRAQEFGPLREAGYAVLLVEFPGYGRSAGSPSEKSVTAALVAAYDWAVASSRFASNRILGYGRSLGGGAIAQLAARRPLAALVLESTFENLEDVVMSYGVPRMLLINHFDTRSVLRAYRGPVLLLHGTRDRVFASRHAEALAAIARNATLHLEPCGHNDCPRQWDLILGFLARNGVCRKPETEAAHEIAHPC